MVANMANRVGPTVLAQASESVRLLTLVDVVGLMRQRRQSTTQQLKQVAGSMGITSQYFADICAGRREPGPKVLEALGLERVVGYRWKGGSTNHASETT